MELIAQAKIQISHWAKYSSKNFQYHRHRWLRLSVFFRRIRMGADAKKEANMKTLMLASVAGLSLMAAVPAEADFNGHVRPFGFYSGPGYHHWGDRDWRWRHFHHRYES
jgi:hypothetical protein